MDDKLKTLFSECVYEFNKLGIDIVNEKDHDGVWNPSGSH